MKSAPDQAGSAGGHRRMKFHAVPGRRVELPADPDQGVALTHQKAIAEVGCRSMDRGCPSHGRIATAGPCCRGSILRPARRRCGGQHLSAAGCTGPPRTRRAPGRSCSPCLDRPRRRCGGAPGRRQSRLSRRASRSRTCRHRHDVEISTRTTSACAADATPARIARAKTMWFMMRQV